MKITFEISDEYARTLQRAGIDLACRAKEALLADLARGGEASLHRDEAANKEEAPYDPGDAWERFGEEIHKGFAAQGVTRADFEDALRGIRPLPKSDKDRELGKRIREAKNTEPNVVLRRADIVFTMCGNERIPTLRQFIPDELKDKMGEELTRERREDLPAFLRKMQDWILKRDALFDDLTSRPIGIGGEEGTPVGNREKFT